MPDILDAIDGALADYGTSDDAMRWNPDPPRMICDGGDVLWPERWQVGGTCHVCSKDTDDILRHFRVLHPGVWEGFAGVETPEGIACARELHGDD